MTLITVRGNDSPDPALADIDTFTLRRNAERARANVARHAELAQDPRHAWAAQSHADAIAWAGRIDVELQRRGVQ